MSSLRRPWDRRAFLVALAAALAATVTGCTSTGGPVRPRHPYPPRTRPPGPQLAAMPCGQERVATDTTQKEIAQRLVSSAENSSLNWRAQYAYIEDIGDGRGFTGGIIGFCSGTNDMLRVVARYTQLAPANPLAPLLPALQQVNGTSSHQGLTMLPGAWRAAAQDPTFRRAQDEERDRTYFDPAVAQAMQDGLRALGQFCYYDAIVMHGPGNDARSFGGIRAAALRLEPSPAEGGDETAYLHAFLDVRTQAMRAEAAHSDTSRIDTAQRVFLQTGNLDLRLPLRWKVYGDNYELTCG
jgi:chitosanase